MTGHGGNNFLKFQDQEEINAEELGKAVHQMYIQGRYRNLLFIIDTCQAATMAADLDKTPNVIAISSSLKDQSSYSVCMDHYALVLDRQGHWSVPGGSFQLGPDWILEGA